MLLINLHSLKHSYAKLSFCESNFAPILEFAIFYHFRHIRIGKTYIFSEFLLSQDQTTYEPKCGTTSSKYQKMAKKPLALSKILLYFA